MIILLSLLCVALNILDIFETKLILNIGGKEVNPVLALMFKKVGFNKTVSIKMFLVLFVLLALIVTNNIYGIAVLAIILMLACLWNAFVILSLRRNLV